VVVSLYSETTTTNQSTSIHRWAT